MLTGSPSNVGRRSMAARLACPAPRTTGPRDGAMLGLARAAIGAGVPVLAICRGIQERNVALGGTLHQRIQELPGMLDHCQQANAELGTQYGPAHPLALTRDGFLARLAGWEAITVNALHAQGIDKLADCLAIEAVPPDGQVEAVRITESPHFVGGVQWHPEWPGMAFLGKLALGRVVPRLWRCLPGQSRSAAKGAEGCWVSQVMGLEHEIYVLKAYLTRFLCMSRKRRPPYLKS